MRGQNSAPVPGEVQGRHRGPGRLKAVTEALAAQGAQAAILGCTEIGLLLKPEDTRVPLFDTTVLHAAAAVELALEGE